MCIMPIKTVIDNFNREYPIGTEVAVVGDITYINRKTASKAYSLCGGLAFIEIVGMVAPVELADVRPRDLYKGDK